MQRPIWLGLAVAHLCGLGCAGQGGGSTSAAAPSPSLRKAVLTPTDAASDPCRNFADFACGTGKQPLGLLQTNAGIVATEWRPAVRAFLDKLASGAYRDTKTNTARLREYYLRCTDAKMRDLGAGEIAAQLDGISKIETLPELARALGALHRRGAVRTLIQLEPSWEAVAPNEPSVARFAVADPKLPRKVYANDKRVLAELRRHWQTLAKLEGDIPLADIEGALRVDRWLASRKAPDDSDPTAVPQPLVPRSVLEKAQFPWPAYLSEVGLPAIATIRPASPDTLANIDALARLPIADLKSSLKLTIIERSAEFIGRPVFEEEIRFHQEVVSERDHEVFALPQACADLMWRVFTPWVNEAFLASLPMPGEQPALELFDALRDRFARMVGEANWLDDATRRAAATKVRRIALRFVSDTVPGLDDVVLRPGSFLDAHALIAASSTARYIGQIGAPPARKLYAPRDKDAVYSSLVNGVWISPVYARYPWIQARPFNAINFGSLGTLMGHEIAHALTITGRRFDDAGLKRETWPKEAVAAFDARTASLEAQLRATDVGAKWKVDAHRTLDEDIAELVGIEIALAAMDANDGSISAFAREQQRREFFLAYAQQLCGWYDGRDDEDTFDDDHSSLARMLSGILANVPEFAETFHCSEGGPMAPQKRGAVW